MGDTYNAVIRSHFANVPVPKVTALKVQAEAPDFATGELVYHDIVIRTEEEIFLNGYAADFEIERSSRRAKTTASGLPAILAICSRRCLPKCHSI